MSRMDSYLQPNRHQAPTQATRAASTWVWISQNPSEITVSRGNTTLDAQTVRIESQIDVSEPASESGKAAKRMITLFGVVGHPSIADTDLRRGDRFSYSATPTGRLNYEVIHVDKTQIGQIQAECETMS